MKTDVPGQSSQDNVHVPPSPKIPQTGKPLPPDLQSVLDQLGNPLPPPITPIAKSPSHEIFVPASRLLSQLGGDIFSDNSDLVRRHSLSILDRSPPANSLAADILGATGSFTMRAKKSILANIADIQESLTDFNSCQDSSSESSSAEEDGSLKKEEHNGFLTVNERNRHKK